MYSYNNAQLPNSGAYSYPTQPQQGTVPAQANSYQPYNAGYPQHPPAYGTAYSAVQPPQQFGLVAPYGVNPMRPEAPVRQIFLPEALVSLLNKNTPYLDNLRPPGGFEISHEVSLNDFLAQEQAQGLRYEPKTLQPGMDPATFVPGLGAWNTFAMPQGKERDALRKRLAKGDLPVGLVTEARVKHKLAITFPKPLGDEFNENQTITFSEFQPAFDNRLDVVEVGGNSPHGLKTGFNAWAHRAGQALSDSYSEGRVFIGVTPQSDVFFMHTTAEQSATRDPVHAMQAWLDNALVMPNGRCYLKARVKETQYGQVREYEAAVEAEWSITGIANGGNWRTKVVADAQAFSLPAPLAMQQY